MMERKCEREAGAMLATVEVDGWNAEESGIPSNLEGKGREMWYPNNRRIRWAKRNQLTAKNSSSRQ